MEVMEANITSEKRFSDLWERSLELRPDVVDGEGNRYEVVFPGIRNQGAGPDFRGAVLRRDGRSFGGDVELHLEQSGWRAHGHHLDPAYSGVALQVVLKLARGPVRHPGPPTAAAIFPLEPARQASLPGVSPAGLEELGVERFFAKSAGFRVELDAGASADQAMYRGVMEAMGYARNRGPFLALSGAAPLSLFAPLRDEPRRTAEFGAFAALATVGNVLERIAPPERGQVLRVASRLGARRGLSAEDWSMFRVRPSASPVNRMRAMASIVADSRDEGLSERMRGAFERGGAKGLVKAVSNAPHIGRGFALTVVSNVSAALFVRCPALGRNRFGISEDVLATRGLCYEGDGEGHGGANQAGERRPAFGAARAGEVEVLAGPGLDAGARRGPEVRAPP